MTDRIFIRGLALHAYHGVMPHEAKVGQTFSSISTSKSIFPQRPARTRSWIPCPMTRWWTCASDAFCGERYRLIEGAAGRGGGCRAGGFSARCARCG